MSVINSSKNTTKDFETSYDFSTGSKPKGDSLLTRREGKRLVFEVGVLCQIAAFVCLFIAYVSPNWIISWPRVYSPFKRIGLWEACFAGLVLETDPTQKAYHGCWWILAPEYMKIRSWVMPNWFVVCQVTYTLCFLAEIIGLVLILYLWGTSGGLQRDGRYTRRDNIKILQTTTAITVITSIVMVGTSITFGTCTYTDRQWLPYPFLNYLSWSYGLAVLSAFFSIFASIPLVTYTLIIRQQLREPPRTVPAALYMPPGMSATPRI